jgi:hypothetical protein
MPFFRVQGPLVLTGGLFCLLLYTTPAAAQETLRGRVADASDSPLPGAVVLLHAVTDDAGTELDRDTADAQGRFELSYAFEEGPLYFVATRVDGEIFMAEPFRDPPADEIVLRAGAGVEPLRMGGLDEAGPVSTPVAGETDDSGHAGWWVALIGAVIVGGVAWLVHRSRRRAPRARELLLEIARLDETNAGAAGAASDAGYRARREELRARLIEALELDPDAARH